MMRIQYASDLHIDTQETRLGDILKPVADVLILAGDIGNPFHRSYKILLKWCMYRWDYVILVPGNHEYHDHSIEAGRKRLKKICSRYGIYLMDNDHMYLSKDIVVIGSTLWSYIPQKSEQEVINGVSDYHRIKGLTIEAVNRLHMDNREWLSWIIQQCQECKIVIVVSHHAPVDQVTSAPMFRGQLKTCAYSSDCTGLMEGVDLWIFGHTHYNTTFIHGDTVVTSNQRGYRNEIDDYDPVKVITIVSKVE